MTFQLSVDEKEQLTALAKEAGVTMSQYIRRMLEDHVNSGKRYSLVAQEADRPRRKIDHEKLSALNAEAARKNAATTMSKKTELEKKRKTA